MHKKSKSRSVLTIIAAFMGGVLLAASVFVFVLRQYPSQVTQLVGVELQSSEKTAQADQLQGPPLTAQEKNFSMLNQGFGGVIGDLRVQRGADLERATLNNLISINQNSIGMLHIIADNTDRSELREFARSVQAQRKDEVERLFNWQAAWGYVHH